MIDTTIPVEVYRNLNAKAPGYTYSVRQRGKVVAHVTQLALSDCTFVVQPGGRERVRREKRKNVHAYIRGMVTDSAERGARITYDPYQHDTFVLKDSGRPVRNTGFALCTPDGVYVS